MITTSERISYESSLQQNSSVEVDIRDTVVTEKDLELQAESKAFTGSSKMDEAQTGLSDFPNISDDEKGVDSSGDIQSPVHSPGLFTDSKGNLKFVNLVVKYPCAIFTSILIISLALSVILVAFVFRGGNPFADNGRQYDMKDIRSTAYDSLRLAKEHVQEVRAARQVELEDFNRTTKEQRAQEDILDVTYWVYESETAKGLFGSPESISAMREAEVLLTDHESSNQYCWKLYNDTDGSSKCRSPVSALNMYYASSWDAEMVQNVIDQLSSSENGSLISNIDRYNALGLCIERRAYCELVPPNFTAEDYKWARTLNANITTIYSSWDGKGQLNEENLDQVTLFAAYLMELATKKMLVDFNFDKDFSITNPTSLYSRSLITWGGPLELTSSGNAVVDDSNSALDGDEETLKSYIITNFLKQMNKIASPKHNTQVNSYYFMPVLILDVIFEIVQQDAMLAVISFLFVFFYIRLVVGSWFLACVGILEITLSIPLSWFFFSFVFQIKFFSTMNTLCLFIVAAIGADDIFIFMDAYKQSAYQDRSVLNSLESRMSWVYRRTGSAMAITSATTCSAFLCTLITPLVGVQAFGVFAALVIFIDYILVMTLFFTAVVIYHNRFEGKRCCSPCTNRCKANDPSPTMAALEVIDSADAENEGDRISNFFRTNVAGFLLLPWLRAIIFAGFIAWIAVASIFATKLEPTKETEQFLNENHPLQKSFSILNSAFPIADRDIGLMIYFTWGIDSVNRMGVNQLLNPSYFGTPSFLDTFDFNQNCQTEMLKACDNLRTNEKYRPFIKQQGGLGSVKCFVEELGAYALQGSLDDCNAVKSGSWKNETWQLSSSDFPTVMDSFVQERSCYSDEKNPIVSHYENGLGWDGKSLRYASISVESAVLDPFSSKAQNVAREQYNMMINISEELNAAMETSCGGKVVMTDLDEKFVFMNNQGIYVRSAVQSSLLGVAIAFTVLLIATKVLHIAFFATLSIAGVLLSVAGAMVMLGWSLGSVEAILISITAGFSVDYVVHLAHAYERANGDTSDRLRSAFGEMGISVLNGMLTSVGASLPLFFCQLQFFKKFGTFLCLTIAFSWVFANFAFMGVLAQAKIEIKKKNGLRI